MKNQTKKDLETSIKDMEEVVNDADTSEDIKDSIRPSIAEAKRLLAKLNEAVKEDVKIEAKANIIEKKVAKVVKKSAPVQSKKHHATTKRHVPAKKTIPAPVKKIQVAKSKSKRKIADIKNDVKALLASLNSKTKAFNKGRSKDELVNDANKRAKKPGKRKSASGETYWENRANRSDINRKGKPYLAKGGQISNTYYLNVDLDERGEYGATVYNSDHDEVWSCRTEVAHELVKDGFLKYKPDEDLDRLAKYLSEDIKVIPKGTRIVSEVEFERLSSYSREREDNKMYDIVAKNDDLIEGELDKDGVIAWANAEVIGEGDQEVSTFDEAKAVINNTAEYHVVTTGYDFGGSEEDEFAYGGLFQQTAPQGKRYRWQNDKAVTGAAKHVGWRYTDAGAAKLGVKASKVPTAAHIQKYKGKYFKKGGISHRYVYQETRKDKSDVSPQKKLFKGGQTAPQGQNYSWPTDKVNPRPAKPVGWRYTDAGAARLGVSSHTRPTESHIDKYKEKTFRMKGDTHRYLYEETRKDKSDINQRKRLATGGPIADYIGRGDNINICGYQTSYFINSPKAVEQFEKAQDAIESQYTGNAKYYDMMKEALSKMAEKVDTFLGLEAYYSHREISESEVARISQLLCQIGMFNYKSGLNVETDFLGEHMYNLFCYEEK